MIANPLGFEPAEDSIPQQANPLGFDPVPDQPEPAATPPANPLGFAVADDQPDELGIGQEVRGTGRALVRGVIRADQAVTALGADRNIDALTTLTSELAKAREAVTAFDQEAQANPRFGASGSAWRQSQVARIAGIEQEIARRQGQVAQAFPRLARREQQAAALPPSPDLANLGTDFWRTLATNPVETIAAAVAESLPQAVAGMAVGAAIGGPVGGVVGAGSNSLAVEYGTAWLDTAREAGVDTSDPQAIQKWFSDPANLEAARTKALQRGIPVALFDAATAGLAGRFLAPAVGQGVRRVAAASAKELGVQAAGGMAGETAGQLVSEGRITSVPDIVLEGIAELGTAPGEVAGNLRAERQREAVGPVELPASEFAVADRADDELPGDFVAPPVVPVDEAVAAPPVLDDQAAATPPPPAAPVNDQAAAPAPPVDPPPLDAMAVPAAEVVAAPAPPAAPVADATVEAAPAPVPDAVAVVDAAPEASPSVPSALPAPDQSVPVGEAAPIPGQPATIGQRILTKLDELDASLSANTYSDPMLLTPMAKVAVKIAKVLVRGGMALQDAIVEAVKRARQEIPDAKDDPDALAQAMTSALNVRQFTEKVDEAPDVPDPVKQAVENRLYVRKPNEDTATFAGRVMDAVGGPAPAIAVFTDQTNGLGGAERSMLGMLILKRLAAAGDHEGAAKFMDDYLAGYSTDAAQALQAFAAFGQLTPQGALFYAKRQIDKASAGVKRRLNPVLQQVAVVLNDINQAGINNAAAAPDVQKAAGALIESSLVDEANGPGTMHDALMIELTNSLDQMRGAREARAKAGAAWLRQLGGQTYWGGIVRSSAKALANQLARQTGVSVATVQQLASDMAKAMLDQINAAIGTPAQQRPQAQSWASRLATLLSNQEKAQELWTAAREALAAKYADNPKVMAAIAGDFTVYGPSLLRAVLNEQLQALDISLSEVVRTHYRFAGDGANLRDKLIARLGLSPDQAQALAKDYDALIRAEYQKLQAKLGARVAAVKRDDRFRRMMRSGVVSADMLPDNELDRVIALELRARRLALGKIIREHYTWQQAAGQDLAQSIAGTLGVDPAMAATVADAIRRRFEANVKDAKARAIERIARAVPGVSRAQKQAWQRIVELSNLGALDSEQAWQAVAERLKLPRWTTAISQEVNRRADEIQRAPEGLPRQQKVIELHNYLARTAGVSAVDLGMAFWYANMLSGPVTQFLNLWANTLNLMTNTVMAARHPRDVWPQVVAAFRGAARGGRDAAAVLRTGINTRTGDVKLEASRPLELVRLPGKADFILTPWRLVGRGLAAGDALFFRSGQEMRAVLLARQMARAEGLRGPDLERRVRSMLAEDSSQRAAAMQQATAEGLTGNEWSRRVDDILTRQRPEDLRANSRDYALKLTFNNKPYGLMGAMAGMFNWGSQQPFGWPLRLVVPFTNVIANVVNESLNYTPVGLGRAIYGQWSGDLDGKPISDPNALGDQYAKAATGTLLLALIAMAKASGEDEDDPWFDVSGSGPNTSARRNQLRASGWIPYGVKVNGRWVSYANSPLAIPLAVLGNFYDARRFRGLDDRTAFDRLAWALFNFGKVITDQSFLDGVAALFSTFDRESTAGGEQLMRQFGRTATTAVIPNALRQIDRMFDPTVYDAPSATAALVASVPFARRANRRTLNVWGEPVSNPVTRRFTSPQGDPMAQELARMGLWISAPRPEDVKLRGEPLTDAQFYEFTRVRGQRLRQMLEARGVMANLRQLPEKARASVWDRYQSAARAQGLAAAARVRE